MTEKLIWLTACIACALAVYAVYVVEGQQRACDATGRVLVRGVVGFECVAR